MIRVRPVRPDEHEAAGALTARAYAEFAAEIGPGAARYLAEIADVGGRADRTVVLVAEEDGGLLGTATLELAGRASPADPPLAPGEAHIRMLGVDPMHRRRGIGRALLEACIDRARDAGKTMVTLNTTRVMAAAQRMYEERGFRRGPDRAVGGRVRLLAYALSLAPGPADDPPRGQASGRP
jgi:ribosomal protein S18 acetylase RimI-like enzyme